MDIRRVAFAISVVSSSVFISAQGAAAAQADPSVLVTTECYVGGGFVKIALTGITLDDVDVVIDGTTESPYLGSAGEYLFGIYDEGAHSVVVQWPGHDDLFADQEYVIECAPYVAFSAYCAEEDGSGVLNVVILDEDATTFDI